MLAKPVEVVPTNKRERQGYGIGHEIVGIVYQEGARKDQYHNNKGIEQVIENSRGQFEQIKQTKKKEQEVHQPENELMVTEYLVEDGNKVIQYGYLAGGGVACSKTVGIKSVGLGFKEMHPILVIVQGKGGPVALSPGMD
jgi:hypothetical protein